jgi:hypothetical protein
MHFLRCDAAQQVIADCTLKKIDFVMDSGSIHEF